MPDEEVYLLMKTLIRYIIGIKISPRLRFRMLPVGGVFSCLGTPGAGEWNGFGLSMELPAGPGRG